MPIINVLPHLNASLNSLTAILLICGLVAIKKGNKLFHRRIMLTAISVSAVFLVSYLIYHFNAPVFQFPGSGITVPLYYTLLVSHVILATVVTPLVCVAAWRALRADFDQHKRIVRWTWPIWMFVTISGVMIYVILYHIYQPIS